MAVGFIRSLVVATLAAGLMLASGCGKTETGGSGGDGKKLRLAFVTNNAADFWTIARAGVNKAATEIPNIEVEFKIPGDATAATQKQLVDDLLVKGIDGIAISPIDPANQTRFLNDVASKAMLVTQDSDAPTSNRAVYIGTDNVAAGRQAGNLIKRALPQGGKIMVFVGSMDAQNARDRLKGIEESIAGSNVSIIGTRTDGTDIARAKANAQDTLVSHPDVAALVGLWSYNGPAILSAVKAANKTGTVKIICFDEDEETLAGVKSGDIFATVVQQPYEFGRQSMTVMAKVLRGDQSVIPQSKQIYVPTLAIDQAGVEEFWANLKQLRGR